MTTIAPSAPEARDRTRTKTDREVLEAAVALVETDGGWTQGTYCRDADGAEVHPAIDSPGDWVRVRTEYVGAGGYRVRSEPGAAPCSFCLEGALRTAAGYWHQTDGIHEQVSRLEYLLLQLANSAAWDWPSVNAYNDDPRTTQAEVVLLLKRAAAHLDTGEQTQP